MGWSVYGEHELSGHWVVTDYACHKTRSGPFVLEADAVSVAVDARRTIRAVYGADASAAGGAQAGRNQVLTMKSRALHSAVRRGEYC